MIRFLFHYMIFLAVAGLVWTSPVAFGADAAGLFKSGSKEQKKGNHRDALALYQEALSNGEKFDDRRLCFAKAVECLNQLGDTAEFDRFSAAVLAQYPNDPELLTAVAKSYLNANHSGFLIGGEFIRGYSNSGGESVDGLERDRVTALRLLLKAIEKANGSTSAAHNVEIYLNLAHALRAGRSNNSVYKLQYLTDLSVMPPFERMYGNFFMGRINMIGAPVDRDGQPVYYRSPPIWNAAVNDGERWRWSLRLAEKCGYASASYDFAFFLYQQFDVYTALGLNGRGDNITADDGQFALSSLSDEETIAGLANGIKKIKLPTEFNYIKILQQLAESKSPDAAKALTLLAQIYQSRMQFKRAAECYTNLLSRFGDDNSKSRAHKLEQITGNLGNFLESGVFAAGEAPTLYLQYRNAPAATIMVRKINLDLFLSDIKSTLRSGKIDKTLDACNYSPEQIGNALIRQHGENYLLGQIAEFNEILAPDKRHRDNIAPIKIPVSAAGAYLVMAKLPNGNRPMQVVWLTDAAIIGKTSGNTRFYATLDAANGKPLPAKLSFFGVKREYVENKEEIARLGSRYRISVHEFDVDSDTRGFYLMESAKLRQDHQYLVTAKSADGKTAVQNYSWFYGASGENITDTRRKTYCITDCPIYRPGQKVSFKYWIRNTDYDRNIQDSSGKKCTVTVTTPRGQKAFEQSFTIDQGGAFAGSFQLPAAAELGTYNITTAEFGGNAAFKVEEYVKPEYEINLIVPERIVKTGEMLSFNLQVAYYFGAPVVNAKIRYKVVRHFLPENPLPLTPWRWLYSDDTRRIPNIKVAGRAAIACPPDSVPETVMSGEIISDSYGKAELTLDTASVKALYGNIDCRYVVTAETEDCSGHTVYAVKSLITAGKPFKVFCWSDNGFYRTDEPAVLKLQAVTADNKNVTGSAAIKITRSSIDKNGKPVEITVKETKLAVDGTATLKFKTGEEGLYRVNCDITDNSGNSVRGKCIIRVFGEKKVEDNYAFQPLEILTGKSEYQPGDNVEIAVGCSGKNSSVLLFSRVEQNKDAAMPELLEVRDHIARTSFNIRAADMPNIFIEAWAVVDGKIYNEVKQILIPPEKKVLNIAVTPLEKSYKPGQKAGFKIKVTDLGGAPVAANLTVTGYDKAVEYISGGSNVPDINAAFWGWTRFFQPNYQSNLSTKFYNLHYHGDKTMQPLNNGSWLGGVQPHSRLYGAANANVMAMGAASAESDKMVEVPSASDDTVRDSTVRKNFSDSLLWVSEITTNQFGEAEIFATLPDNLTTWKIRAWGIGSDVNVGQGETELAISKNFIVRLILPRFLTEDDEATITGIIHNYSKNPEAATVSLHLEGNAIRSIDTADREVSVMPKNQAVCEWRVRAFKNGNAAIEINANGKNFTDAVKLPIPVLIHGQEKQSAAAGCLTDDSPNRVFLTLNVPEERIPESTLLTVKCSSGIAGTVIESLPFLAAAGSGNDSISVSARFATVATVMKALKKYNIKLDEIIPRQIISGENSEFPSMPVSDPVKLQEIVNTNLDKIAVMQNADGGWGWFSGFGETSWVDTTATVVTGLIQAKNSGAAVDADLLARGINWLKVWQNNNLQKNQQRIAKKQTAAVSNIDAAVLYILTRAGYGNRAMTDLLYEHRSQLSLSALAMLGLTMKELNDSERLQMLLTNLKQYLFINDENHTAYLKLPGNHYNWNWYENEIVTQAYYLKLLSSCAPRDPVTRGLACYLAANRANAAYWNSIRDTALCVDALSDYYTAAGEDKTMVNAEIYFDGQLRKKFEFNAGKPSQVSVDTQLSSSEISSGRHTVEIRRYGTGNLFYNSALTYFSLEKFITSSGGDLKIERRYYRITEETAKKPEPGLGGTPQIINTTVLKKTLLKPDEQVKLGDIIEVELLVTSANDYDYITISDYKVPGFEPQQILSGYSYENLGAYMEFRNNTIKFHLRALPRGKHAVTYRVKAEIQGIFSAVPAAAKAVYSPQLRANSNENTFNVGL